MNVVFVLVSLIGILLIVSMLPQVILLGNEKAQSFPHRVLAIGAFVSLIGDTGLSIIGNNSYMMYSIFIFVISCAFIGILAFDKTRKKLLPELTGVMFSVIVLVIVFLVFIVDHIFLI